jgi:hypothetical protein
MASKNPEPRIYADERGSNHVMPAANPDYFNRQKERLRPGFVMYRMWYTD